jgi:hypothetical protein
MKTLGFAGDGSGTPRGRIYRCVCAAGTGRSNLHRAAFAAEQQSDRPAAPAELLIASDSYPAASDDGRIAYKQQVSLRALSQEMAEAFDWCCARSWKARRFIHGVDPASALPKGLARYLACQRRPHCRSPVAN